jgi:hypothetical protein
MGGEAPGDPHLRLGLKELHERLRHHVLMDTF